MMFSKVHQRRGRMKRASKGELFENVVIHRCCAFWMLGVFTDHYMRCNYM